MSGAAVAVVCAVVAGLMACGGLVRVLDALDRRREQRARRWEQEVGL